MAINQNHLFEDLNGVKCAIVEKNASGERVAFLRRILEYNHYTVVVVPSPPPKAAPAAPAAKPAAAAPAEPAAAAPDAAAKLPAEASTQPPAAEAVQPPAPAPLPPAPPPPPPAPETFTVGVTDVTFNSINAIFGRLLKAPGGHVVTLAYWQQKDKESHDEVPYFESQ